MTSNLGRIVAFLTVLSVFKFTLAASSSHSRHRNVMTVAEMDNLESNRNVKGGAELYVSDDILPNCVNNVRKEYIPDHFDARQKWPYCPSLWEISDQGECASCWAVSVTTSLTDRYCIANRGEDHFQFSADDLLTCGAEDAAWDLEDGIKGCRGGNVRKALNYMQANGSVSGGSFRGQRGWGCKPYEILPCNHKPAFLGVGSCGNSNYETPQCARVCQPSYSVNYDDDRKQLTHACAVNPTVEDIQTEIMKNGPVVAVMKLWNSFFNYNKTEVFRVQGPNNYVIMNHAVKIIGWGTELQDGEEVPYWLVSNSWNYYWGDNGFFKIIRGAFAEGAYIEKQVSAGIFQVPDRRQ